VNAQSLSSVLVPGNVVAGKFRVERTVGEGGMAVVVAATHIHLEQLVAVKFFRGDLVADQEAAARFTREAKAAAQIRSEYVARVLDAGVTEDEIPYIAMEYLEGRALDKVLAEDGRLNVQMAVEIAVQACEGLAEAHARGVVHRDIKPSNLFLVERAHSWQMIKILDFGISKVAPTALSNITTNVMMGTPCYMSPEQLRSTATVDQRTDIWSLGATLYELLSGNAPFDPSQGFLDLADAIVLKPLPSLRELRPEIPEGLDGVVARCLAKDRGARFSSAAELAMALLPFAPPRASVHAERAAWIASMFRAPRQAGRTRSTAPRPAASATSGAAFAAARTKKWMSIRLPGISNWAAIAMGVALAVFVATSAASIWLGRRAPRRAVAAAPPSRQAAPTARLAATLTSELVVRASPPSARIAVDGVSVEQNPLRRRYPRTTEVHRVAAYADGYEPKEQDVSLTEDVILNLSLSRRRPISAPVALVKRPLSPLAARRTSVAASTVAPPSAVEAPSANKPAASVDPGGGRAPLHPIVTRNPYETP
jgi:tRNA A-37 threonylcarbamoyl transferase component Bud32